LTRSKEKRGEKPQSKTEKERLKVSPFFKSKIMYLLQLRDGSSELFNLAHILRAVKNTDAQGDFTQILLKYPDTV